MTTHTITLARHTAQVVGLMGVLVLGTWDSYGTEQLLLRPGPEWEGLAIDATFHNVPNDEGVTVLADTDGLVTVPPEACMRASKYATITFRGVQDGVQRISCNLPYMVLDHAQVPGANSTATPSENAQALAQMQDLRDGAVDAKNQAEAARDGAANSATAAASSAVAAAGSAAQAEAQKTAAAKSASDAKGYMQTASGAATAANASAENAEASAASAANAAKKAADESAAAVAAQKDAAASKAAAKTSEDAAAKSASDADSTANSINNSVMQIAANKEAVSQLKEELYNIDQSLDVGSYAIAPAYNGFATGKINPVLGREIEFGTETWFSHYYIDVVAGDVVTVQFRRSNETQFHAVGTDINNIVRKIFDRPSGTGTGKDTVTIPIGVTRLYCGSQATSIPPNNYAKASIERRYTIKGRFDVVEGYFPRYLDTEYVDTIGKVRNLTESGRCAVYGFMTDLHFSAKGSGHDEEIYRTGVINALLVGNMITHDLPVDCFVFGGDYEQFPDNDTKEDGIRNINEIHDYASKFNSPFIVLAGNHEAGYRTGGPSDDAPGLSSDEIFMYCHKRNLRDTGFRHISTISAVKIDDANGIAIVCLSSYGSNYSTVDYAKISEYNQNNYPVVVFAHFGMDGTTGNAYSNVTRTIDLMRSAGLDVIAWISGHNHADWSKLHNGTWIISCLQSGYINSKLSQDGIEYLHTYNSDTESALSIFVINTTTRTIDCVRFGLGVDRSWNY